MLLLSILNMDLDMISYVAGPIFSHYFSQQNWASAMGIGIANVLLGIFKFQLINVVPCI